MSFLNPDIEVYLNETVDFLVDTPNQPFWIKQKPEIGPGETNPIWANRMDNNGATSGRLRVRFNQPGTYYYTSQVDARLMGKLIVLPIAKRQPDPPNQTFVVRTGLPIARASDATVLLTGDTDLSCSVTGQVWEANATEGQIFQTSALSRFGPGCIAFSTPGLQSGTCLRNQTGSQSNVLIPFSDSWTIEFWISFSTFNEDDPDWDEDGVDNPIVRLIDVDENGVTATTECPSGDEFCGFKQQALGVYYNHRPLAENAVEIGNRVPFFHFKMYSSHGYPSQPAQTDYVFNLPRLLTPGSPPVDVINAGVWNHIAFTRDVPERTISLYINGQRYGTYVDDSVAEPMNPGVEGTIPSDEGYTVAFGGDAWGIGGPWWDPANPGQEIINAEGFGDSSLNGYMDDIRITRGIVYRGSTYTIPTKGFRPDDTLLYEYDVTSEPGSYIFDGEGLDEERDPTINGRVGDDFVFTVNAPGHPFWIKDAIATGPGNATETWATLSGNGSEDGTVTATFLEPGNYYYICEYHSPMVGQIKILPALL